MSLKSLVLLISIVSMVAATAVMALTTVFIHSYIIGLVPDAIASTINMELWVILALQAVVLILMGIGISILSYIINARLIYRPLRNIIDAMNTFIAEGKMVDVPSEPASPREVQALGEVFRQFTNQVQTARSRDQEVSRMKTDFISTAAHQLRTPLTGIRWALEALQKSQITPDQQALIDSAVDKSHDLVGIIGTLLDITSIESGKYKYRFEPVDLGALVQEMTKDFSPLAQTRQVSLYYVPGEGAVPKARADRERIKWILNNLIENAIRYTPANGTVRVYLSSGLGRVFVHVKDTGIGIQTNDRANIFERFYRAPNAVQKENEGNGLGLYIARTIATDHGGDLDFEANTDGPGTTFTLSLPIAN